jgi:response regulator of citrate/malate metabolism
MVELTIEKPKKGVIDLLLIEDQKEMMDLLVQYCDRMGIFKSIIKAYDGADALVKMRNQRFGLILLDLHLPKKDGLSLIQEIVLTENTIKNLIVVSGIITKKELEYLVFAGVKNILAKPFLEEEFRRRVLSVVSSRLKK